MRRTIEREHPWHLRRASAKHEQWLQNLVDLHELTRAWRAELGERAGEPGRSLITRGLPEDIARGLDVGALGMLRALDEGEGEGENAPSGADRISKLMKSFLDDTAPEDALARLEHSIWTIQAWSLSNLILRARKAGETGDSAQAQAADTLTSRLAQSSWKAGRRAGEARWPEAGSWAEDLRAVIEALSHSPFQGRPEAEAFLIRRALPAEASLELRVCPHQIHYPEVRAVADELCALHGHWLRGFLYAINHRITAERTIARPRCVTRLGLIN